MNGNFNDPNAWSYSNNDDPYFPPVDPVGFGHAQGVQKASTAKSMGIFGILAALFCCCLPVGLVLGILAVVLAQKSARLAGTLLPDAKIARVLGIIAIVLSAGTMIYETVGIIQAINDPAFWEMYEELMQQYPMQ